ncbi:hypothetical protein [Pseudoxanthomonas wuyuanensis]
MTSPKNLLSKAAQGFRGKQVVHSGHAIVTDAAVEQRMAFSGFVFHTQLLEKQREYSHGVFLANPEARPVFASRRQQEKHSCTYLSTVCVDKSEFLSVTVGCVIFVIFLTAS